MLNWRENKLVGIIAVIIFLCSLFILVNSINQRRKPRISPEIKAQIEKENKRMQEMQKNAVNK